MSDAPTLRERILSRARSAIVFERLYPPQRAEPAMSFFGGRPIAHDGFPWPANGSGTSQLFLGQLALADLPPLTDGPDMPRDGVVYFFAPSDYDAEPSVVHVPEAPNSGWPEQAPPVAGETIHHMSWRQTHFSQIVEPPHVTPSAWPKYAVRSAALEAVPEAPTQDDDVSYGEWKLCAEAIMSEQIEAAFGSGDIGTATRLDMSHMPAVWMAVDLVASHVLGIADYAGVFSRRDLDPKPPSAATRLRDRLGISRAEDRTKRERQQSYAAQRDTQRAVMGAVYETAYALVQNARAHPPLELIPDTVQAQVETLWQALQDAQKELNGMGGHGMRRLDTDAIALVIEACLAEPHAADLVSPEALAGTLHRHRLGRSAPFWVTQMFGFPRDIQGAASGNADALCLLQCHYDPGQDWYFGDAGAFQFWISPEELASGAFEGAWVTFEAH